MRRVLVGALLLHLGACSWSNSLYQARQLSSAAAKAEREERTFDAGSLWGQVAVKADSAYARNPAGSRGAEALWLRGRALARLGDCPGALPVLERALVAAGAAEWDDDLRVELARCRAVTGNPDGALEILGPILAGDDPELRGEAGRIAGRALVSAGRWDEALVLLEGDDSDGGRWERTIALAELGRTGEALEEAAPRLEAADSSADWDRLVRVVARRDPARLDEVLARLGSMRSITDDDRARWQLSAGEALLEHDPAAGARRLEALLAGSASPSGSRARMLLIDRRFATVHDRRALAATVEDVAALARGDAAASFAAGQLARRGREILAELAASPPGTPEGDLAMFFQATIASDSLHAPALASWLLLRLERGWPDSPYVPKALLARLPLAPDSADAIRARLAAHADSPYLAFVAGRHDPRFATLEDALGFYIDGRLAEQLVGGGQDVN